MMKLGTRLAEQLRGGEVVALVGGLGAGKTRFAKGLVAGLGAADEVTSPTFAIVQEYRSGRLPVAHLDLYRLENGAELEGVGWDEYLDEGCVMVVEWADKFPDWMPEGTRWLRFSICDDGTREVDG